MPTLFPALTVDVPITFVLEFEIISQNVFVVVLKNANKVGVPFRIEASETNIHVMLIYQTFDPKLCYRALLAQ